MFAHSAAMCVTAALFETPADHHPRPRTAIIVLGSETDSVELLVQETNSWSDLSILSIIQVI